MKKICVLLFLIFTSINVNAENFMDNTILGIAFINQTVDMETTGSALTASDSGSGLGIYLDKYYKKKYRFNGTFSYVTYDDFDISQLMVSADHLFPVSPEISFFGGVAAGGALQKYTDASVSDSALGLVYGVQTGAIAFINDNIMLELGYRLRPTSIETEVIAAPGTVVTINDLSETYISILLMF
ncbi:MAG: porin family protein [Gammaproteobacteria bacterium]|nr:porin family protein [Gammaproteobacteria bacterium]